MISDKQSLWFSYDFFLIIFYEDACTMSADSLARKKVKDWQRLLLVEKQK